MIGALCLELGERLSILAVSGFVATAKALVGRPLTPASIAGVARRTVRRCAVGLYVCLGEPTEAKEGTEAKERTP
jgi:hypothetical protein